MSCKTVFLNEKITRQLSKTLKKELKSVGVKYSHRYVANIEEDLRALGEIDLISMLKTELECIINGEAIE